MSKVIVSSGLINFCHSKSDDVAQRFFGSVTADNIHVLSDYLSILEIICEYNMFNMIILHIPCIEYYVLETFAELNGTDKSIYRERGLYKSTKVYKYNMTPKWSTFERYCKALVSLTVRPESIGSYYITSHYL